MSEQINKSYFAIIPANVRYDNEITPNAKLLYGEITALTNDRGYCWATNKYFSDLYNVSTVSVSKWINSLVKKGYITSDFLYKEGTKEIDKRCLRIVSDPIKEKFNTPIKDKFKDNSTYINNTNNNNNNSDFFEEEEKPKPKYTNRHFKNDLIEYGFNPDLVDEWMQVRKNKRATNSKTAFNKFINQVELNGNDKNFILETCIAKSWGSFEASYNLGNVPNKVVAPNNQVSKQIDPLEYFGYELNPDFNVR